MAIRLSIMTLCHSTTPYLAEMLESFLRSGYHFKDTEMVIHDNASPPGGDGDTAREYARRYPDLIRVVRSDTPCNLNDAYQRCLDEAKGRYLLNFDYDDVLVPFDFDAEMDFLDAHDEYGATYGIKRLFNRADGDMRQSHGGDSSLFAAALDPRETFCGMIYRTSDLRAAGGWHPVCVPDPPMNMPDVISQLSLNLVKPFYFRCELRGLYRRHENQNTVVRGEGYPREYQRLRAALAEYYAPLYNGLRERRTMRITPGQRRPAVALLGTLMMRPDATAEEQLAYCAAAETLMPDDYGIREYRIKVLAATERYPEALSEAFAMFAEHRDRPYIAQLAFGIAAQLCEKTGLPAANAFLREQKAELDKLFALTPAQRELLDRTVANFRAARAVTP